MVSAGRRDDLQYSIVLRPVASWTSDFIVSSDAWCCDLHLDRTVHPVNSERVTGFHGKDIIRLASLEHLVERVGTLLPRVDGVMAHEAVGHDAGLWFVVARLGRGPLYKWDQEPDHDSVDHEGKYSHSYTNFDELTSKSFSSIGRCAFRCWC